jgi:hypothetical protein
VSQAPFSSLISFIVCLLLFILIQRGLHKELQGLFLLITRKPALALGIFSLLFLPGVFIHEISHLIMAKILRVPTGKFSIIPQVQKNGVLRLGYVETAKTDVFRDALIGTAPLISGLVLVWLIGVYRLGVLPIAQSVFVRNWAQLITDLSVIKGIPDFWLWFYLAFAISSTMLPSSSDRRGWLPVALVVGGFSALALLAGAGEWLAKALGNPLDNGLQTLALIFAISLGLHIVLIIPSWGIKTIISRATRMQVV